MATEGIMENIKIYAFADEASSAIDGQIKAMLRNGLTGLEIRNVDGTNISDITIEKAKEVKSKLDANGLVTWSIGSPIGKIGIDDDFNAHLEKFKHTLEVAHTLGAENIRLFSFYTPDGEDPCNYKSQVIEKMAKLIEASKGSGINLCHENEKAIYGDIPERCLELFKALPELKGIFDPANFVQSGVDTLKAWDMLKENVFYMHIKDAKTDGSVVPAGEGAGNLKKIVNEFITMGGKNFTIEPHLTVFDGFAQLEKEGEKSVISGFTYPNSDIAFDTACTAFKNII